MNEWSIEDSIMFDQICSSDSPQSSDTLVPLSKRQITMRKYRAKRRENHKDLKRLVALLQDKLQQLQERHDLFHIINRPSNMWYELALKEKIMCKRVQDENIQLKEMIQQQMSIAKTMSSLMTKATDFPNLTINSAENQWQNRILVKNPSLRIIGMHKILDYEYDKLNSAFVEAGLIDASEIFHKLGTKFSPTTGFELQKILENATRVN
ncbi:hypothetical protein THRCLA_10478 [Thraustotheca clavata]|uniref:BZIP domain-containing protein n=1 Tax=Thraustotheca clavata TaxID=74557 RepID=A0A1V9YNB8_9STRA|nr:hypothetical protein THRCLA_10478 [Thraustotheca clavata]